MAFSFVGLIGIVVIAAALIFVIAKSMGGSDKNG
jgi:hypothetical protein